MKSIIISTLLLLSATLQVYPNSSHPKAFNDLNQAIADTSAAVDTTGDPAEVNSISDLSDSLPADTNEDTIAGKKVPLVYVFEIKEMIAKPIWRTTKLAFAEARKLDADLVLIDMNTYGGEVSAADSIRTFILNSEIPVYVFINDNAASAGALISIACDSIYMKPSAKIGAATVVNQSGEQVPDKFQSYMRATMRATAEAQGKDTVIVNGDTTLVWHRDPTIAEAMVDPKLFVPNISDTGKVLTFTATEAMENGYCEGIVNSREEILELVEIEEYTLKEYTPSRMDKIIGFLVSPYVSSILIMVIIGGIYFELQSPGIGFPLAASALAALLYFAPLYLEGMAEYWELLIFILGIILLLVEVFAIPGFGVAGAAGVLAVIFGLAMSMVNNDVLRDFEFTGEGMNLLMRSFGVVTVSAVVGLSVSIWVASKVLTTNAFARLVLGETQNTNEGYISVDTNQRTLVGKTGTAYTVLRPSGKVQVDEEIYDGKAEFGLIEKGAKVKILRYESGQVYVVRA